jgi:cytochrome b561
MPMDSLETVGHKLGELSAEVYKMSVITAEELPSVTGRRYRRVQVALHWLVVALITEQYATSGAIKRTHAAVMAGQLPDPTDLVLHTIHNRIGLAITGLMALRLFLRWRLGPAWTARTPTARVAAFAHAAFYGLIVAQGTTGFIAAYFWWPLSAAHAILFKAILALAAAHVLAALWHHFVWRDDTLAQMVPGLYARSRPIPEPAEATGVGWMFGSESAPAGRRLSSVRPAAKVLAAIAKGPHMAARWIALAMGLVVLSFVGLFAGAALRGPAGTPSVAEEPIAAASSGSTRALRAGSWTADVTVAQSQGRSVALAASIRDGQGRPVSGQPVATISELGMGMEVSVPLQKQAPGTWRGSADLPMAGAWTVTLELNGEKVSLPLEAGSG